MKSDAGDWVLMSGIQHPRANTSVHTSHVMMAAGGHEDCHAALHLCWIVDAGNYSLAAGCCTHRCRRAE